MILNDEPQPSSDVGKKDDEAVSKESGIDDQEMPENSTQDVNTTGPSINTEPDMFSLGDNATLEATHADFFSDETEVDMSNITTTYLVPSTPNTRIHKDHSLDHVIGDVQSGVQTRRMTKTTNEQGFISVIYEMKTYEDLYTYLFTCFLSQEEPKRIAKPLSDSAWVEAMQEELLQIEEEVYVYQPLGFEDPDYPEKVYKVVKAFYGLHQAPRAWYETLAKYLLDNGFHRGKIDHILFIKKQKVDILLVQMSSMGELTFFLGFQVKQKEDGMFISQDKYVANILRMFSFTDVKTASTPMDIEKPLLKAQMVMMLMFISIDSKSHLSDYARASLDKKSTIEGCQFLGCRLLSWQCKKETLVTTSSTEAEYMAAASCCGQEVDINKKAENRAKMTKLSMEWKRLCKIKAKVLGTCGELDAFVSIPDEGDMAFLQKKVKSGAAVGKLVLLQDLLPKRWKLEIQSWLIVGVFYLVDFSFDLLLTVIKAKDLELGTRRKLRLRMNFVKTLDFHSSKIMFSYFVEHLVHVSFILGQRLHSDLSFGMEHV
ncbi:putative ribonuclease H-like domain-containing protein [Tanacetum coccineum]